MDIRPQNPLPEQAGAHADAGLRRDAFSPQWIKSRGTIAVKTRTAPERALPPIDSFRQTGGRRHLRSLPDEPFTAGSSAGIAVPGSTWTRAGREALSHTDTE